MNAPRSLFRRIALWGVLLGSSNVLAGGPAFQDLPGNQGESFTLPELLKALHTTLPKDLDVKMEVFRDTFCKSKVVMNYTYAFELLAHWKDMPITIRISMLTDTSEQMIDLYSAVSQHYPARGLPPCMQADTYSLTGILYEHYPYALAVYEPKEVPGVVCPPFQAMTPLTSCVKANPIYP